MNTNNLPVKAASRKIDRETIHVSRVEKGDYMGCTLESVTKLNKESRDSVKKYIETKSKGYGLFVGDLHTGIDIVGFDNPYDEINNILLQVYESLYAGWHCQFAMMDAIKKLENYEYQERLQRADAGTFLRTDEIDRIKAMFGNEGKFTYYLRALYALRQVAYKAATITGIVDKQNPMYPLWEFSDMLIKCLYRQEYDYTSYESSIL